MEGEVAQLSRLNSKILEGLGRLVNLLVYEFPLNLVGRYDRPPEVLVKVVSHGLENRLGQIQVTTVLDDFTVHKLRNLGHGVVLRAVELVGLTYSAVIVQHMLKSRTDIRGLDTPSMIKVTAVKTSLTYVNRPEALLQVVGSKEVGHTGELVKEIVFESKHRRRTDDGGLWVDSANNFLSPSLYTDSLVMKLPLYVIATRRTLVAKYSEGELLSALYEET